MYICEVRMDKTNRGLGKVVLSAKPQYGEKLSVCNHPDELVILDIKQYRNHGEDQEVILKVCSIKDHDTWMDNMMRFEEDVRGGVY